MARVRNLDLCRFSHRYRRGFPLKLAFAVISTHPAFNGVSMDFDLFFLSYCYIIDFHRKQFFRLCTGLSEDLRPAPVERKGGRDGLDRCDCGLWEVEVRDKSARGGMED